MASAASPATSQKKGGEEPTGASVMILSARRSPGKVNAVLRFTDAEGRAMTTTTSLTVEAVWSQGDHCVSIEYVSPRDFTTFKMGSGNTSTADTQITAEINCMNLPATGTITLYASSRAASNKARFVLN